MIDPERKPPAALPSPDSLRNLKEIDSGQLLGPSGEVTIRHDGRLYRLRRTRHGKLILTA